MWLVRQSFWFYPFDATMIMRRIEEIARTCYQSAEKMTEDSCSEFCERLVKNGHAGMFEHVLLSCRIITDRATGNEIVRHRLASYAQESTRYCNYQKKGLVFVLPVWIEGYKEGEYNGKHESLYFEQAKNAAEWEWFLACRRAENGYKRLIENGWEPQQARAVLPLCTKTEIVMSANLREWQHFFKMRCAQNAHPQLRELAQGMQEFLREYGLAVFFP